jgi:hypothetical protein
MLPKKLDKKVTAARIPGTTSIANAFLIDTSCGGKIMSFEWLERFACQNGMANIAALLLFVFNPSTKMFQEAKRLEEDQVYLVIPSCIGTSTRSDPKDVWSANGGVRGVGGVNDTQEFGRGTNMGASEMQRSIVDARDIKADPNLMRVPLKNFCDAMAGVGAIPLQVEIESQRSSLAESAATAYVEDDPPASRFDDWGNKL